MSKTVAKGNSKAGVHIKRIGDNLYLAEVNGIHCTAIFNPFVGRYFVDDVYGIVPEGRYE